MTNNRKADHIPFPGERLISLDALRGLDMFLLAGPGEIFRALQRLSDNAAFTWLAGKCSHPGWHGFALWDIIFPMFIFIMGVAMPFSFSKRPDKRIGKKKLYKHIIMQALTLAILGVDLWEQPGGAHPEWGYRQKIFLKILSWQINPPHI